MAKNGCDEEMTMNGEDNLGDHCPKTKPRSVPDDIKADVPKKEENYYSNKDTVAELGSDEASIIN